MITGTVKGQSLRISSPTIAADTISYLTARFVFTSDWDGAVKFAHFSCGENNYSVPLTDDEIREEDKLNLGAGTWKVWLHGERYEGGELTQRITTEEALLVVRATGSFEGEPFPTTPSEIERLHAEFDKVKRGVQSDLGQNDETAADFVRNRTHYDSRVKKTIEKTFENITEAKLVKLADADIDINRIVSYSVSGTDGENTYNIIVTDILIDDISEMVDKPTGSVFDIRPNDGRGRNLNYFAVPVEIPDQSDDGSDATVTYHGLYSSVDAVDILVKFEINIESGELKKLDQKYIPEIDPSNIKDMYYTAVEEIDLAGYTLTNVNYEGDHDDVYPFELGQVWNATGQNINFTNLKVKQADDGTLYIGDLNKSNPPFFISTTSAGALPQWLNMANPGSMNLVGVSGKVTTEIIHKIHDKYIPDSIAYKDQLPAMAIMKLAVSDTVMITDININDAYDSALVIVKTNSSKVPSLTDVIIHYKNNTYYKRIISALTDSEVKNADIPYIMFLYIDMNKYGKTWLLNPVVATTEKMDVIIPSNSYHSTKKFKITVDDNGTLSAAEVNT